MPVPRIAPAAAQRPGPGAREPAGGEERAASFLARAEVRDVLAWLRLLVDPQDAAAVVRALARPPVELRQVELARVIQLARRRKLDLVAGLTAATESPQVPPEARDRIRRFVELHRSASAALDTQAPQAFIASLTELLGTRGRPLLAPEAAAERQASLARLLALAGDFVALRPDATPRELARHLAAAPARREGQPGSRRSEPAEGGGEPPPHPPQAAVQAAAQVGEAEAPEGGPDARERRADAREGAPALPEQQAGAPEAQGGGPGGPEGELGEWEQELAEAEPLDRIEQAFRLVREEVLEEVARIGGCLGELRLDTELDVSHGVVRYLELLKLAALLQRPSEQGVEEALADLNARLLAAATPLQREIFQTSTLDETLLAQGSEPGEGGAGEDERSLAQDLARAVVGRLGEHSLSPFLPRKGIGLALSASDIQTYRSCPLRYKFARVLRIPVEQTLHQRFGIAVHQVLERYHADGASTLEQLLELLGASWRRAGFGLSEAEQSLYEKARAALTLYHARLHEQRSEPVWFERSFSFRLGPHHLRGRVDRVDRLAAGEAEEYELIDYKTSRPKTAEQLADDLQLSLYALAAREAWQLDSSRQAYYYVLDDLKVPVPRHGRHLDAVTDIVLEVGEGILSEHFEPTPSPAACSLCDYRIVCPAAEA